MILKNINPQLASQLRSIWVSYIWGWSCPPQTQQLEKDQHNQLQYVRRKGLWKTIQKPSSSETFTLPTSRAQLPPAHHVLPPPWFNVDCAVNVYGHFHCIYYNGTNIPTSGLSLCALPPIITLLLYMAYITCTDLCRNIVKSLFWFLWRNFNVKIYRLLTQRFQTVFYCSRNRTIKIYSILFYSSWCCRGHHAPASCPWWRAHKCRAHPSNSSSPQTFRNSGCTLWPAPPKLDVINGQVM